MGKGIWLDKWWGRNIDWCGKCVEELLWDRGGGGMVISY